jgi:hypothetical protein
MFYTNRRSPVKRSAELLDGLRAAQQPRHVHADTGDAGSREAEQVRGHAGAARPAARLRRGSEVGGSIHEGQRLHACSVEHSQSLGAFTAYDVLLGGSNAIGGEIGNSRAAVTLYPEHRGL